MHRPSLILGLTLSLLATGCAESDSPESAVSEPAEPPNPLFVESVLPYGMPPFDLIENGHFVPAFERGMAEEMTEIVAIASNPEPASFENTR